MRIFWKRGGELERELRSQRPEAPPEFVSALARRIDGDRYRHRAHSLRLGLAIALSISMLVVLAGFGALGYAASGVTHAAKSAVHVVAPAREAGPDNSLNSATAQYLVQVCFHGHTLRVDSHAVRALRAAGATPGACRGGAFTPATKQVMMCFRGHNVRVAAKDVTALRKLGFTRGFCKKK